MVNKYESLDAQVRRAGFYTNGVEIKGDWDRTTVCSKRLSDLAYGGHSFWVTDLSGDWYVGTWGGLIYRIPEAKRVASLCIEWLSRYPDRIHTDFDDDIKAKFTLVHVSDEEFDAVAGQTIEYD
jgi:hypothetical protein